MKRMYHAPMEIDGHKMFVDIPWFSTRDEYLKWYEDLRKLVHETYDKDGDKT